MSYDANDAAYDQWMDDLYKEHKAEAISEFTAERLQSYYLANPTLAEAPRRALSDAVQLFQTGFINAGFVFAHVATETGLKAVVLKPFLHGLVHSTSTAEFVSDLASHVGLDRFRDLLFRLLLEHAGLDFLQFKRQGAQNTLWAEIERLQKIRNRIMALQEHPTVNLRLAATEAFSKG
jgi:hypothetical protein